MNVKHAHFRDAAKIAEIHNANLAPEASLAARVDIRDTVRWLAEREGPTHLTLVAVNPVGIVHGYGTLDTVHGIGELCIRVTRPNTTAESTPRC